MTGLAYHVVVRAMEARARMDPLQRLWLAVRHATSGQLPYERYHQAGLVRAREHTGLDRLEAFVQDWLSTDLNPAVQSVRLSSSVESILAGYNAYNESAPLSVRTSARVGEDGAVVMSRRLVQTQDDPEPCRFGTFTVLHSLLEEARQRARAGVTGAALTISQVARSLGAGRSATAEAAAVFETRGAMPVSELARAVGCGQRTLERRLKQEGGTAEQLRASTRIVAATHLLGSAATLTQIAFEAGFADAAHMSRSFRAACGMAPSKLRESLALR